jgi:hypothetical protein
MATKEWKDMSKGEKAGGFIGLAIIVIGVIVIGSIILGNSNEPKDSKTNTNQQTINTDLPEDQQLRQIVENALSGKNNLDKDYIRNIDITAQADGGWGVFVEYNADDNVSASARKKSIELKMSDVYIALYTSSKDVRNASVAAYFPLTDSYGNESEGIVYKTVLGNSEADRINFKSNDSTLRAKTLPNTWETTALNQDFR